MIAAVFPLLLLGGCAIHPLGPLDKAPRHQAEKLTGYAPFAWGISTSRACLISFRSFSSLTSTCLGMGGSGKGCQKKSGRGARASQGGLD